ncbi:MAG TPA: hypothetical protein VFY34_09315, partial [Pyrinomonadaceae bacterium]|nr:hypothetical protein [Pyrinomonadaceae bacterium]
MTVLNWSLPSPSSRRIPLPTVAVPLQRQIPNPQKLKQTTSSAAGTLIANADLFSQQQSESGYAENVSHGRVDDAAAMFQLPRFTG